MSDQGEQRGETRVTRGIGRVTVTSQDSEHAPVTDVTNSLFRLCVYSTPREDERTRLLTTVYSLPKKKNAIKKNYNYVHENSVGAESGS